MKMHSIAIVLISILMLSACGGSKTVRIPPEELTTYPEQVSLKKNWAVSTGKGEGKWFVRLQPAVTPTVAMTEQHIFTADFKGRVSGFALNEKPRRIWQTKIPDVVVSGGVGAGSDLVLVGTQKGRLIALSQDDGEILWRTTLSSEILSPPQAQAGIVVALTEDSRVFGLDAGNGKILWQYRHTAPLLQLRGSSPIIIDEGIVYAGFANGFVAALDLTTGELLWQEAVSYPRGRSEIDRIVDVGSAMAVYQDILYVVNYQGRVIAIDTRTQHLLWEQTFSSYQGLAVNQNAVFITDDESRIFALDRETGHTLWQQEALLHRDLSAPAAFKNMIAVGDFEGFVHLLDAENGQLLGRTQADSAAIHTPPLVIDDSLYVLSSDGELTRLTPIPVS